jgi:hypothetical protein
MILKVKLYSTLSFNRFEEANIILPVGATLRDLLAKIEITEEEVSLAFINGESGSYNQILTENDHISFLPFISDG